MPDTDDALTGGETLTIDEAAKAYALSQQQAEPEEGQPDADEDADANTTDDELQASDEDASEETDGETEDEGQAEDEDGGEPDTEEGRFVASNGKVRLPDGTVSTIADLIQGNLRDRDYRQKTMEAAEVRKTYEAQSSAIEASKKQLAEQFGYVQQLVQSIIPPEPDPEMANPQSPKFDIVGYMAAEASRKQWAAHLNYLTAEQQRALSEASERTAQTRKERADKAWANLLEKAPEFRDEKRVKAFVEDSFKHGEAYGFSREEIAEAVGMDHRMALAFKDAMAWRKLQASKPKAQQKTEGRPTVIKGGKRLNPAEHRARAANDAFTRLKQTGSEADAVAAYLASRK